MNIFVVNVFYNEVAIHDTTTIYRINADGSQTALPREEILYEKVGTVVLVCEHEDEIMETLRSKISDKITNFELVSVTDLAELEPPQEQPIESQAIMPMTEATEAPPDEPEEPQIPIGKVIFQIGI